MKPKRCVVCEKELKARRKYEKYCGNRCRCEDISQKAQKRITKSERTRWHKRGPFGRKMISKFGFKCRSRKEVTMVNFLVQQGISFVFEPPIPESKKHADVAILQDSRSRIIFVEMDGLDRQSKRKLKYYTKIREKMVKSWGDKIDHYKKLLREKKIDGYLIVTPKTFRKKIRDFIGR